MAITKVINDAVDLNQTSDYSGLRLPVGTTGNVVESFTTDYLVVGSGGGTQSGGGSNYPGGGGAGGLRTSYNNSTTTTNSLSFPSGKTAIATYMLNNNATDVSGNYNGTEFNISYNTGKYGGGAVFNGSSSKIQINQNTIPANNFSVSMWFNLAVLGTKKYLHYLHYYGAFIDTNNKINFYVNSNLICNTILSAGVWYHVVLVKSSAGKTIYLNGTSAASDTSDTGNALSSFATYSKAYIGAAIYNASTDSDWFNGSIDQVRIYDTALSGTDASNIYSNEVQALSGGGSAAESSLTLSEGVAYDVTVGGATTTGADSTFSTITASGGGRSGGPAASAFGSSGGSGGGGGGDAYSAAGGNGTLNQGYAGGSSGPSCSGGSCRYPGGGGGGAAGIGENATTTTAGNGGEGLEVNIIGGTGNYYAGGGGGSSYLSGAGSGGLGGGGDGSARLSSSEAANDGAANTGGGGGGGLIASSIPALGGSGVVILRYPTANVSSFTTTGTLNTPSTTDTLASATYPITNTAYYKLDGNATDSSGNGNNGAESNVTWANGRFGQAAVFNSTSQIVVSTISSIKSYSFWIKGGAIGNNYGRRLFGLDSSGYTNCVTYIGNATSRVGVVDGSGNVYYSDLISDGNWHHAVVTTNGTDTLKIYTDGNLSSTNSTSYFTSSFTHIGSDNSNRQFSGSLDQIRIFSTELSSSQVSELYNEHYQTKFTDGSDTAIVFTEGTGTVTFSGVDPAPPQGALRTNTSYSEDGSASVIEHYNGTNWKYFDAIKYCTTNTLNFPSGAGCIASYNLDNNFDDIGNTYNGINNGVTFNASGKFGAAAVFNGSSSEITVSSFASLSQVGISMWVNMPNISQQAGLIARYGSYREFAIYMYGGTLTASIYYNGNNGNATSVTASTYMSNNTWHHIAYTADGVNQPRLYIDGAEVGTAQSNNNTYYTSSEPLDIGHFAGISAYNYEGKIDQVRIFNDSLTSDEVSKLYNNEIACS